MVSEQLDHLFSSFDPAQILRSAMHVADTATLHCTHGSWGLFGGPIRRAPANFHRKLADLKTLSSPFRQPQASKFITRAASDEQEPVDIDSLARQLSREAEKLRKQLADQERLSSSRQPEPTKAGNETQQGPFGYEVILHCRENSAAE